jgi:hypothetical protein
MMREVYGIPFGRTSAHVEDIAKIGRRDGDGTNRSVLEIA